MKINTKALLQEQYLIPLKIISVYLLWKIFHHFALIQGTTLNHYWNVFVYDLGSIYAYAASAILSLFGMKASSNGINIDLLESNRRVWVQDHCLAIPAIVVFIGSVVFFKGTAKDKLRFILIGLMGIILINMIRIIFVAVAFANFTDFYFNLNHSLIYVVITYGFIFYMIARWMNRTIEKTESNNS
jgi:exosortase/archaeosortase family protein